jgi:hypothetical protein
MIIIISESSDSSICDVIDWFNSMDSITIPEIPVLFKHVNSVMF